MVQFNVNIYCIIKLKNIFLLIFYYTSGKMMPNMILLILFVISLSFITRSPESAHVSHFRKYKKRMSQKQNLLVNKKN